MKDIINTKMKDDGTLEIYLGNRLFVEVADGRDDEEFITDVLYGMGYEWLPNGQICPLSELPITKEAIYDEICAMLTAYEEDNDMITEADWYELLVKIQNNWEAVITVQEV